MKIFKLSFLALAFVAFVGLSSCDDEDDTCTPPALSANIVGTWSLDYEPGSSVTFNSDGTYNDDAGVLLDIGDPSPDKTRTYTVDDAASTFQLTVEDTDGQSIFATFTVADNQCDQITLDILGITAVMSRQ